MLLCDSEGIPYLVQKFSVLHNKSFACFDIETEKFESFNTFVIEVTLFNNCKAEISFTGKNISVPSIEKIEYQVRLSYRWLNETYEYKILRRYAQDPDIVGDVIHRIQDDLDRFYFGKLES